MRDYIRNLLADLRDTLRDYRVRRADSQTFAHRLRLRRMRVVRTSPHPSAVRQGWREYTGA